ncbi:hypothetical protein D0C27_15560 [Alcaligenes faecalis]|uniref:GTPase n=1 Tax=Alcaligenes faecalis TaxID=511 RepID=UPI0010CA3E19|nr:GTPase [Alcaligenes faecalis]QCP83215.1 hypothetical protein D0C27_15560 [Alcaligenes faecalis]
MLPYLIGGAAVLLSSVGAAIYKYYSEDDPPSPSNTVSLKRFAIWGRPNVGKTTFIARLCRRSVIVERKEASTSKQVYTSIPPIELDGNRYLINEIVDMPGTKDRLADWLDLVRTHEQVFYLVNLGLTHEKEYQAAVRHDLKKTVEKLLDCEKQNKTLHIIFTHIDKSHLSHIKPEEVNNQLHDDEIAKHFLEYTSEVKCYMYAVNLMDENNFQQLINSIVRDANA